MFTFNFTTECQGGVATNVKFTYTPDEISAIKADPQFQERPGQFDTSFTVRSKSIDGCYKQLRGMAITLAKADRPTEAVFIQATYELHFGISIHVEMTEANTNLDR